MLQNKVNQRIKTLLTQILFPTRRSNYALQNALGSVNPNKPSAHFRFFTLVIGTSLLHYLLWPLFWAQQIYAERLKIKSLLQQKKHFDGHLKQIAIYSPWFDKFAGGSEAVTAYMAQYFEERFPESTITILSDDFRGAKILQLATLHEINEKYGTKLQRTVMDRKKHHYFSFFLYKYYLNLLTTSAAYDLFINCFMNVSPSNAAVNLHYIHFPGRKTHALSEFMFRLYRNNLNCLIANSAYTSHWTKRFLETEHVEIVEPPVTISSGVLNQQKKKIIVTAGRFASEKNLPTLIDAFISSEYLVNNYVYHLVGPLNPEKVDYFESLQAQAKGYPVHFFVNLDRDAFISQLDEAMIYWHGMGHGHDLETYPEFAEHFGITVVEAMSSGCVPIVFDHGGPADIVQTHQCGLTWNSPADLVAQTEAVLRDKERLDSLSKQAYQAAKQYSVDHFMEKFGKVVDSTLLLASQQHEIA